MKNSSPTIYFDLDGTLYDLYSQPRWLERITTEADPTAYANDSATMVNMVALHETLFTLMEQGWSIGVISWLARGSSREYDIAVRRIKRDWVKRFLPMATEVHIVKYGTPKHSVAYSTNAVIVDDAPEVLTTWNRGATIDATQNILPLLEGLGNA